MDTPHALISLDCGDAESSYSGATSGVIGISGSCTGF